MTEAPDKIAIAIVTFNRSAFLAELLQSAAAMTTPAWRIVVVDNASTDDTQQVLADAQAWFPDGVLVNQLLDTNTGGSGGFSEGTRVALELGADWVWLMDDDVEILPDALERFAPWMERFGCIHGRRYDFDGSPEQGVAAPAPAARMWVRTRTRTRIGTPSRWVRIVDGEDAVHRRDLPDLGPGARADVRLGGAGAHESSPKQSPSAVEEDPT